MKTKIIFYLFILTMFNCSYLSDSQTIQKEHSKVKGEILKMEIGKDIHGHPLGISTTLIIKNSSKGIYLLCGENGIMIFKNDVFTDTLSNFYPIIIKPNSIDTLHKTFFILKNKNDINKENYAVGELIYKSNANCKVDSTMVSDYQIDLDSISLSDIKPIDYLNFNYQ